MTSHKPSHQRTSHVFPHQGEVSVWLRKVGQLPHAERVAVLQSTTAHKLRLDRGGSDCRSEVDVVGGNQPLTSSIDGKPMGVEARRRQARQLDRCGKVAKEPHQAPGRATVGVAHLANPKSTVWLRIERVGSGAVKGSCGFFPKGCVHKLSTSVGDQPWSTGSGP